MKPLIALAVGAVLCGGLLVRFSPELQWAGEPNPVTEDPGISETELQLYIAVYSAMQDDHDLTIEEALIPHGLDLVEFRSLERRIQKREMYVDRVREALLEHAKNRAEGPKRPPGEEDLGPEDD